ncbi:MAG: hypothetical protein HY304_03635 [candidate division Zixibacteria bacterium]|nr:hypothetical protein [candidate division Zixibacteria bacterium]
MKKWISGTSLAGLVACVVVSGCGGGSKTETGQKDQSAADTSGQQFGSLPSDVRNDTIAMPEHQTPPPTPAKKTLPSPRTELKVAATTTATPPPTEVNVAIPVGTTLAATLLTPLRTDSNHVGDEITATVADPVTINGTVVLPVGAVIRGHLTQVEEPHRTSGRASMTLSFDTVIDHQGRAHTIETAPLAFEAKPDKVSDAKKVGAGAIVGGAIGLLTSKNKAKGAIVGAAVGAAAGGGVALATKGKQLELPAGKALNLEVSKSADIPVVVKAGGQ